MDLEQLQQQYALVAKEWNEKKSAVVYKYLDIINVLCDAHWDKIKRADSTTRNQLEQQHEREEQELHEKQRDEERLLQELYEPRIHTIVDRMIALSAQDQTVSPYWRVRILSSKKELAPSLQDLLQEQQVYSQAELNDLLRRFLKDPEETKRCGSIELEVTQVTVQPPFLTYHYVNISQREILKRWVYFVDFHEASNLIGHEDIQQEVLGAWVAIGGQFEHHVTVYLSEADCWSSRPRGFHRICVHRPLPERFRQ